MLPNSFNIEEEIAIELSKARTEHSVSGKELLITCLDECLDNEEIIEHWGKEINGLILNNPDKNVIINFKKVTILTSSGLRNLVMFRYLLDSHGLKIGLCGLNKEIKGVLHMTCLDTLFVTGEEEKDVIASFNS